MPTPTAWPRCCWSSRSRCCWPSTRGARCAAWGWAVVDDTVRAAEIVAAFQRTPAAADDGLALRLRLSRAAFTLDVDLQLPGQGVTGLLGPSGCGKTTVLRCLAGLERAAQGRLVVQGQVWQDARTWVPPHRRAVGCVFQDAHLFAHLSVRRNLAYGQRRIAAGERPVVTLEQAVALLGIGPLLDRLPAGLSGGERQRVAIARALLAAPRLLLLDGPLSALDAPRKAEVLPYLERLQAELRLPIVYVSHAVDEVARLADHVVVMEAGRVRAQGPVAATLSRIDLGPLWSDDIGAVIPATVAEHDTAYGLTRLAFAGGSLWVGRSPHAPGSAVRARVLARDVSLALQPPGATSILNVLPARVQALQADGPDTVLVRLLPGPHDAGHGSGHADAADHATQDTAGNTARNTADDTRHTPALLARITRRSCEQLALAPGMAVHAQVKAAALMR
ncbi:MAG: molybdenum ABC transporter ATP-binding protein [Burkholderiales bacterium]|nr:molybdenum ABC transporter ATP-binding protein [Burkholderiales bacterium]